MMFRPALMGRPKVVRENLCTKSVSERQRRGFRDSGGDGAARTSVGVHPTAVDLRSNYGSG